NVDAETIARPIGVSIGFLVVTLLFSIFVKKLLKRLSFDQLKMWMEEISFLSTGLAILGMVAASGYAGTSLLFSAYLTGVSISYLTQEGALQCYQRYVILLRPNSSRYYAPIASGLLLPFFF